MNKSERMLNACEVLALVGAAPVSHAVVERILAVSDLVVGVDGGADTLAQIDHTPEIVLGDLDSLSHDARLRFGDRLLLITEQDTTDFEKALLHVAAPLTLAVGFLGGRLDHTLAALNVVARHPARRIILIGDDDVSFLAGTRLTLRGLSDGTRISLTPLAPCRVSSGDLRWPLADALFAPDGQISPSNQIAADPARISCDGPLLVTVPLEALPAVMTAVARER